jgi:hypothetical protein
MFGASNASNVQEASSASNKQVNAGRGKYKRHDGVDYYVEWEEEYEGQWGKQKKQWVRDIDIVTPQIIEQYKQSQSLIENKDNDDKYEDDTRVEDEDEYKETEITHTKEINIDEKDEKVEIEDNEDEEEIRALLGQIENDKLTDRNIRNRADYDHFVAAKQEEIDNAFKTGNFVSFKKEDIPPGGRKTPG